MALLQREMAEVKMECDAFGSQIARYAMMGFNQHQQTAPASASHKTTKIAILLCLPMARNLDEDSFVTDIVINENHYSCHKIQMNIMYSIRKSFAIS